MSRRFTFGNGLLRAAVSLVFSCLVVEGTFFSDAATSESPSVFFAKSADAGDSSIFHCSTSMRAGQVAINLPDEFCVALEDDDSTEMVRVDVQRRPFGSERVETGLKVVSEGARIARPDISPPLLL